MSGTNRTNSWYNVELPGGVLGWVPSSAVEFINGQNPLDIPIAVTIPPTPTPTSTLFPTSEPTIFPTQPPDEGPPTPPP